MYHDMLIYISISWQYRADSVRYIKSHNNPVFGLIHNPTELSLASQIDFGQKEVLHLGQKEVLYPFRCRRSTPQCCFSLCHGVISKRSCRHELSVFSRLPQVPQPACPSIRLSRYLNAVLSDCLLSLPLAPRSRSVHLSLLSTCWSACIVCARHLSILDIL